MLQNPCKTLGFKKNMVYEIPPGGGGKPYPASGLKYVISILVHGVRVYHSQARRHVIKSSMSPLARETDK